MAPDWGLAQTIIALIAIPFTVAAAPSLLEVAKKLFRFALVRIRPRQGRCRQLVWSHIIAGRLHDCNSGSIPGQYTPCEEIHSKKERCWESTLAVAMNRTWALEPVYVPKPAELSLARDYLSVDMRTILAFLIISAPSRSTSRVYRHGTHGLDGEKFGIEMTFPPSIYITTQDSITTVVGAEFKRVNGVLLAHLFRNFNSHNTTDITKTEMDLILNGYPPFYKEVLYTRLGQKLRHPIQTHDDLRRGGWVVGLALSAPGAYGSPHAIVNTRGSFKDGDLKAALVRVSDVLVKLKGLFPLHEDIQPAIWGIADTGSGWYAAWSEPMRNAWHDPQILKSDPETCEFIIWLFNEGYSAFLTEEHKQRIEPILIIILKASVFGARTCSRIFMTGVAFDSWWLNDYSHEDVYLCDCVEKMG